VRAGGLLQWHGQAGKTLWSIRRWSAEASWRPPRTSAQQDVPGLVFATAPIEGKQTKGPNPAFSKNSGTPRSASASVSSAMLEEKLCHGTIFAGIDRRATWGNPRGTTASGPVPAALQAENSVVPAYSVPRFSRGRELGASFASLCWSLAPARRPWLGAWAALCDPPRGESGFLREAWAVLIPARPLFLL